MDRVKVLAGHLDFNKDEGEKLALFCQERSIALLGGSRVSRMQPVLTSLYAHII